MTSKYELHIFKIEDNKGEFKIPMSPTNRIEGNSLLEVLAKLPLLIKQMEDKEHEALARQIHTGNDDDIPF